MTGTTAGDNLRYPNDYNAPADVPNDMEALAEDTQVALNKRRQLLVPYTGQTRAEDYVLTPDIQNGITYTAEYTQPSGSTRAATAVWIPAAGGKTSYTEFTIVKAGIHSLELDMSIAHGTVGSEKSFEIGIVDTGSPISAEYFVRQVTANRSSRISLRLTQHINGKFHAYVKPIGTTATGWTLVYARLALIGV